MRVSLDTNVLVYAEGVNGPAKQAVAVQIIRRLPASLTIVPVQVLAETFNVLVRKSGYSRADAHRTILTWQDGTLAVETSLENLNSAADLATLHQLSIWDAIVLAVSADSACRLLLSEDMHEGFTWRGVTVVNPFALTPHPLLEIAMDSV